MLLGTWISLAIAEQLKSNIILWNFQKSSQIQWERIISKPGIESVWECASNDGSQPAAPTDAWQNVGGTTMVSEWNHIRIDSLSLSHAQPNSVQIELFCDWISSAHTHTVQLLCNALTGRTRAWEEATKYIKKKHNNAGWIQFYKWNWKFCRKWISPQHSLFIFHSAAATARFLLSQKMVTMRRQHARACRS